MSVLVEGLAFADGAIQIVARGSLKPQHFQYIMGFESAVGWFEVHPENYFVAGGPMLHYLAEIRNNSLISFHNIGVSLGAADGLCEEYFEKLKGLYAHFEPDLTGTDQ